MKINLISLLAKNDMTPKQLSEKTGLTTYCVNSLVEGRKHHISFETMIKICVALNCEVGDLLSLDKAC